MQNDCIKFIQIYTFLALRSWRMWYIFRVDEMSITFLVKNFDCKQSDKTKARL